jgi:hypothetical protein
LQETSWFEEISLEALEQELTRRRQEYVVSLRHKIREHEEAILQLEDAIIKVGRKPLLAKSGLRT